MIYDYYEDESKASTQNIPTDITPDLAKIDEWDKTLFVKKISDLLQSVFASADTLRTVMACPEIQSVADDDTIQFLPIEYTFPDGRQIIINYETQPKILAQRIALAERRAMPGGDPNPSIGTPNDDAIWTNTDPAWYAIMVVEHGALDDFVGPNQNNTISLRWINDNIDQIYPKNDRCTSKTALAGDNDMINLAGVATTGLDDDTNDYYVAGDANLQWISYAEIG